MLSFSESREFTQNKQAHGQVIQDVQIEYFDCKSFKNYLNIISHK